MSAQHAPARSWYAPAGESTEVAVAQFEAVYQANVADVAAFFARRCDEPSPSPI